MGSHGVPCRPYDAVRCSAEMQVRAELPKRVAAAAWLRAGAEGPGLGAAVCSSPSLWTARPAVHAHQHLMDRPGSPSALGFSHLQGSPCGTKTCAGLASLRKSRCGCGWSLFVLTGGRTLCMHAYFLREGLFVSPFAVLWEVAVGPLPWRHLFSPVRANNSQC